MKARRLIPITISLIVSSVVGLLVFLRLRKRRRPEQEERGGQGEE